MITKIAGKDSKECDDDKKYKTYKKNAKERKKECKLPGVSRIQEITRLRKYIGIRFMRIFTGIRFKGRIK